MAYDLKPMRAPRAAGTLLRGLVAVIENPATGGLLADKLLSDAGVTHLRDLPTHDALDARHPLHAMGSPAPLGARLDLVELDRALPIAAARGFAPETSGDFVAAYRDGKCTPIDIAERALEIVADSDRHQPPMRLLIAQNREDLLDQARASAKRYEQGKPLGPLDGVPIAVKDELDQQPYPTTVGTRFLGREPAPRDATVVARLREQGALLVGKANMHEIGLGVTGLNPHHGPARNPYAPAHATGGSSSGSAAAVGAGLCPIAIGADGGGSIRIPAALCGQVGIKATFGRISEHGAAELCWSVGHVGPIASTVRDLALAYATIAGPDAGDVNSLAQPAPQAASFEGSLAGVKLGVYRPWFDDADPAITRACRAALAGLERRGAAIVDVDIPELEVARVAHLITIVSEMTAAHLQHYRDHRSEYGLDVRVNLALGRRLLASDYVHAQRHRARVTRTFLSVLESVDAIVTPTTGRTAPVLPDDALETGESNLEVIGQIIRFATPANLTGLPAISVPVGYDDLGLPIGLQLMGRAWEEHRLLDLAAAVELDAERRKPAVSYQYFG